MMQSPGKICNWTPVRSSILVVADDGDFGQDQVADARSLGNRSNANHSVQRYPVRGERVLVSCVIKLLHEFRSSLWHVDDLRRCALLRDHYDVSHFIRAQDQRINTSFPQHRHQDPQPKCFGMPRLSIDARPLIVL